MTAVPSDDALRRVMTARGLPDPAYAIVLPLVRDPAGEYLLVEVRAAGIPQAGDPCFPGGRIEPGETPAQAAAREMQEELGLRADPEAFLGQLPTVQTVLGRRTDVFVCSVPPEAAACLTVQPDEVAEVLRVPLSYVLSRPRADSYPFGGHVIWGMTAGAIRHFCAAWMRAAG